MDSIETTQKPACWHPYYEKTVCYKEKSVTCPDANP